MVQRPEKICHNVLIVSDDSDTIRAIQETLALRGVRGVVESSDCAAVGKIDSVRWDLVLAHANWPRIMELLSVSKASCPERPFVLLATGDEMSVVVAAMRAGCDDVLSLPVNSGKLAQKLQAVLPDHELAVAAAAEQDACCLFKIAGDSESLMETIRLACKIAPTSMPVLISGESGTGKELIAHLIHRQSNRRRGPYISVNCAALSESLLESELFGHERGAFTGAHAQRKGRFERAHGGTLLLDEISETGPRLQAELLRVLEQQDFERVGGTEVVRVNVRIISTSNKDLAAEVEAGRFRRDLYYRIAGAHLVTPPLRQRPEDLPALVWHFVNLYSREVRRCVTALDARMMEQFAACSWPGNIRQLRNVVRAALVLGEGETLKLGDGIVMPAEPAKPAIVQTPTLSLQELERRTILQALERAQRNQVKAARLLGITDRTLREKLRRYRQDGQLQPAGESAW